MSDETEVQAESGRCQGYASCVITDPARFDLGDDGKVKVLQLRVSGQDLPLAEEAVRACPAAALKLRKVTQ